MSELVKAIVKNVKKIKYITIEKYELNGILIAAINVVRCNHSLDKLIGSL